MLAGTNRSGVLKKSFISVPDSVNIGDRYLDPEKVDYLYETKLHKKADFH